MANKKISNFNTITDVRADDAMLIDHNGTTNSVLVGSLTGGLVGSAIVRPSTATTGQILMYNGTNWIASNPPTFSGFGSGYLTGIFLAAGENNTFTVPSGVTRLEITAVGSAGNGGNGVGFQGFAGSAIRSFTLIIGSAVKAERGPVAVTLAPTDNQGGGGGLRGVARSASYVRAGGGGAGGWVRKELTVSNGQTFTYTTGIANRESIISTTGWSMSAFSGGNGSNITINTTNAPGGAGGQIGGDYDLGYVGQAGSDGTLNSGGQGGVGRDINGNLGGEASNYSGYIFVKLA